MTYQNDVAIRIKAFKDEIYVGLHELLGGDGEGILEVPIHLLDP